MELKHLITVPILADWLGVSQYTIFRWVRLKKLPYVKLGRAVRFDPRAVEEFIEGCTIEKEPK